MLINCLFQIWDKNTHKIITILRNISMRDCLCSSFYFVCLYLSLCAVIDGFGKLVLKLLENKTNNVQQQQNGKVKKNLAVLRQMVKISQSFVWCNNKSYHECGCCQTNTQREMTYFNWQHLLCIVNIWRTKCRTNTNALLLMCAAYTIIVWKYTHTLAQAYVLMYL